MMHIFGQSAWNWSGIGILQTPFRLVFPRVARESIFPESIPDFVLGVDSAYNLGTRFSVTKDGYITHIRWLHVANTSSVRTYSAMIHNFTTKAVLSGVHTVQISGNAANRWVAFELQSPLAVSPGVEYMSTVSTPYEEPSYAAMPHYFDNTIVSGSITVSPASGMFIAITQGSGDSTAPDTSYNNSAYTRDIIFQSS